MHELTLGIRGKIEFDPDDPDRPPGVYVIQGVAPGLGNVLADPERDLQVRAYVIPFDPRTPAQLSRRDLLRQAVNAWHTLPEEEKALWELAAAARGITRFNAYVSAYLLASGPPAIAPAPA